jgi:hypothetical protein
VVIRVNEEARFSTVLAMTKAGFKDVLVSYRRAVDAGGFQLLNDEVDPSDGELLVQKATRRISIQVKGTSCEQETSAFAITWASLPKPAS